VHGDDRARADEARERREQRRPERVEVDDVVATEHRLGRAPRDVGRGVQVLRVDARPAEEADLVVLAAGRRVVEPAEHVDVDAARDETARDLVDVPLDAAVGGGDALLADHRHAHQAVAF
jgi:hypothetical protein